MILRVNKNEWMQAQDYSTKTSKIVLVRLKDYYRKEQAKKKLAEELFRKRIPSESDIEYFCRVIHKRSSQVVIMYKGQRIKVTQTILQHDNLASVLLAISGAYDVIGMLAGELMLNSNGKKWATNLILLPEGNQCGQKTYFLAARTKYVQPSTNVSASIPGISASFNMRIWNKE